MKALLDYTVIFNFNELCSTSREATSYQDRGISIGKQRRERKNEHGAEQMHQAEKLKNWMSAGVARHIIKRLGSRATSRVRKTTEFNAFGLG
jgi:hypothetical protein